MNKKNFTIYLAIFFIILLFLIRILPRIEEMRPYSTRPIKDVIVVSSTLDSGKDSLREAVTEANKSQTPLTIRFKVSGDIKLETPLPPFLNDGAIVKGPVRIDASGLKKDDFAWITHGSNQSISGLTIYGKGNKGILILSNNCRIEGCSFERFDAALTLGGNHISVKENVFGANKKGIEVMEGAQFAGIVANELKGNSEAGLWAVWPGSWKGKPAFLKAEKNRISGSSSGIFLFVDKADIKGNSIIDNDNGIHLLNSGNIQIMNNEVYQNRQHGILIVDSFKNKVVENSIYRNDISGIMMKGSAGNLVKGNTVFFNGVYGAADVLTNLKSTLMPNHFKWNIIADNGDGIYILASSPVLKGNTVRKNRFSGIRISKHVADGKSYDSVPRIEDVEGLEDPIVR